MLEYKIDDSSSGSYQYSSDLGDIVISEDIDEVTRFIDSLKKAIYEEENLSYYIITKAEELWFSIIEIYGFSLPLPLVSVGVEGEILFTFEKEEDYLELEVQEDSFILFFENRDKDEREYNQYTLIDQLLEDAEKYLETFQES